MYEFLEETVRSNMTRPARSVAPEMTVSDLLRLFAVDDADAYPVESRGQLVGIVSKADALKAFGLRPGELVPHYDDLLGTTVDEVMTRQIITVDAKTRLQRVLHLMVAHHFKSLPVVDDKNRLQGMIRREDVIRALIHSTRRPALPLAAPPVGYYAIA
jgi:CBS domain-containing protein